MEQSKQLSDRIRNSTVRVLPSGLQVVTTRLPNGSVPTFDIEIMTTVGRQGFLAVWAGKGWPADVKRAVGLAPNVDVVFAARISDGAKDWLTDHRIGWLDEAGSANVVLPTGLVIVREAQRNRVEDSLSIRWTKTMLAAVEATCAGVPPTVAAIEARTGMSRGAAANALARLERMGLLTRSERQRGPMSARRTIDVDQLIDQYATAAATLRSKQPVILVHTLWKDALESLESDLSVSLNLQQDSWAVTGTAASTLLAPYLAAVTIIELYVSKDMFNDPIRLVSTLGGRRVDKGHRIEVRELPSSVSADGPVINGIRVALPVRVYADLMALGGRSAEAAQHLREVINVGPHS